LPEQPARRRELDAIWRLNDRARSSITASERLPHPPGPPPRKHTSPIEPAARAGGA
jgi:hypothetical protein